MSKLIRQTANGDHESQIHDIMSVNGKNAPVHSANGEYRS